VAEGCPDRDGTGPDKDGTGPDKDGTGPDRDGTGPDRDGTGPYKDEAGDETSDLTVSRGAGVPSSVTEHKLQQVSMWLALCL